MILVDLNVLLYAVNSATPRHGLARSWLTQVFEGEEPLGFAWTVLLGFLRLSTSNAVFPRPLGVADASAVLDTWLDHPQSRIVQPGEGHWPFLRHLLAAADRGGNLVSDAHLAALALEHNARLATFDRDFGQFPGLRWFVPEL